MKLYDSKKNKKRRIPAAIKRTYKYTPLTAEDERSKEQKVDIGTGGSLYEIKVKV